MPALRLCACLLLVTGATRAGVTGTPRAQSPSPTIVIDITAVDANGVPVTTLRPGDLSVRVDGRVQSISSLNLVLHKDERSPLPAPYATNQLTPGRTIALAVDVTRLSAAQTPAVTEGVAALLDALHARDRVGLVALAPDDVAIAPTTGSIRGTPDPQRRAALGTLDLTTLTAGDYQIRAIVSRNGAQIGRVTQTLRKVAR